MLFLIALGNVPIYAHTPQNNCLSEPENVRVTRKSDTSLKISWRPVEGAKGYAIYRYNSSKKKYQKIKQIKKSKTTVWINKNLKTNKVYRYKVAAYKVQRGKKIYSRKSYWVSAKTYKKDAKKINAGKVNLASSVKLNVGSSVTSEFYVFPSKSGVNKKKAAITKSLRWYSSNKEIATVSEQGTIKAGTRTGSCKIYGVTHNGTRKQIKVTVANYGNPKQFKYYTGYDDTLNLILSDYKNELCSIATYFTFHRLEEGLSFV